LNVCFSEEKTALRVFGSLKKWILGEENP